LTVFSIGGIDKLLEQAVMLFQDQKDDLQEIERWEKAENQLDKFMGI